MDCRVCVCVCGGGGVGWKGGEQTSENGEVQERGGSRERERVGLAGEGAKMGQERGKRGARGGQERGIRGAREGH